MKSYYDYKACIEACLNCAAVCNHCASSCTKEKDVQMMARCIQLDMECATICYAAAQLMSLGSERSAEYAGYAKAFVKAVLRNAVSMIMNIAGNVLQHAGNVLKLVVWYKIECMPSTMIANFYYDKVKAALRVIFTTGSVYEYINVPETEYLGMSNSFSKGIYFNRHIRNRFSFKKIR